MSELEEKLNALMSNPQLMQQVAALAQNMSGNGQDVPSRDESSSPPPPLEPQNMQAIIHAATQNSIDKNQQALLNALSPYLSGGRIRKLERAMRAAKMAGAASLFLNSGGLQLLAGR